MVEPEKCHAVCVAPTRQFDLLGRIAAAQKPVRSDDKGRAVGGRQMENSFQAEPVGGENDCPDVRLFYIRIQVRFLLAAIKRREAG